MQNTIDKFRQNSIVFKKPGMFSENFKTLTIVQYFFLKLHIYFLFANVYNRAYGTFFYFTQILSYLEKLKKTRNLHTRFLHFY